MLLFYFVRVKTRQIYYFFCTKPNSSLFFSLFLGRMGCNRNYMLQFRGRKVGPCLIQSSFSCRSSGLSCEQNDEDDAVFLCESSNAHCHATKGCQMHLTTHCILYKDLPDTFEDFLHTYKTLSNTFENLLHACKTLSKTFENLLHTSKALPKTFEKLLYAYKRLSKTFGKALLFYTTFFAIYSV